MNLSSLLVKADEKVKENIKTNLLFADSFSKITEARKAFEEAMSKGEVESGTEDFESYADSYEQAMELLGQGGG